MPKVLTEEQVRKRGFDNVAVEYADADALPFGNDKFDLVTCRIAPHHFGWGTVPRCLPPI